MTADRPSRPQLELLSDLRVDREERVTPARPLDPPPTGSPRAAARPQPALELRVTPLSWSFPRLGLLPGGLTLCGGPVRLALTLSADDLDRPLPPGALRR